MYKIIGNDGQEYGPISLAQIKQWIAEGRVNNQTLVQGENSTDWKALINFPELAPTPVPPSAVPPSVVPPIPASPSPQQQTADKKIAAGVCGILIGALGIHKFVLGYTKEGVIMLLVSVLSCGFAAPIMGIIGFIEGIMYLTKSDEEFVRIYVQNKKGWF